MPVKSHVCLLAYQPNFVSRQFGLCQLVPEPIFNRNKYICVAGVDYVFQDIAKYQNYHANFAEFKLTLFQPAFYTTKSFYSWWTEFYTNNMSNTTQIIKRLTKAFSFVQEKNSKR